ncbi:MAG: arginine deiminase family protein [Bacteroidota bacterium]
MPRLHVAPPPSRPLHALTRAISPALEACALTHLPRTHIDLVRARAQHAAYEHLLEELGCTVERLPAGLDMPDSVFIEDTAVVFDEIAIITRPGAESRRGETAAVAAALPAYRSGIASIEPPGTLDGGDVLCLGRRLFVGTSGRTNAEGLAQLRALVSAHGYTVEAVSLNDCLHLKTAVTAVADDTVLLNPTWVDAAVFADVHVIEIDPAEPFAANALLVGDTVVYPDHLPRTFERLQEHGLDVRLVPADELAKAEGGLTCSSLLFFP